MDSRVRKNDGEITMTPFSKNTSFSRGVFLLSNKVRNQCHESRALDRGCELTLVPRADAGAFARHDLSEGRQVTAKRICILVVDLAHVHLAKVALTVDVFFHRIDAVGQNLSFPARGVLINEFFKTECPRCESLALLCLCPTCRSGSRLAS